MAKIFAVALSLLGGTAIAVQSNINGLLGKTVGNIESTLISFLVGTLAASLLVLTVGTGDIRLVGQVPPYLLVGGLLGVIVVFATITGVQAIGTTATLTLVILGQLITALIIDHYGLLGATQIPVDWVRGCGVILMLVGAGLIIH